MEEGADAVGGLVHVDAGREGVLADGVELVAVPDSYVGEGLEVSFFYRFDDLLSPESLSVTRQFSRSLLTHLLGTEYSALNLRSSLVLTLFLMPRELEVVFLWSLATQMITFSPGQ